MTFNPRCRSTSSENVEILRALELLLLFDTERSTLSFTQILWQSGNHFIPPLVYRLQLLETHSLLKRKQSCGKVFWGITSFGLSTRTMIKNILDSEARTLHFQRHSSI